MNKTLSIKTLGCKLNQYESSLIAHQFTQNGWETKKFGENVDLVIINTCTVTDRSDKKCRNYIRQGAKFSNKSGVVVTGCLVDRDQETVTNMPDVIGVFSNKDKNKLFSDIIALDQYNHYNNSDSSANFESEILPFEHTRGLLRIQDGCDGDCSYCIVPEVRGKPRSRSFDDVVAHARYLVEKDCPELVFTGVTIGKYNDNGRDLSDLIEEIISIPGKFRVRITSIEPKHVTDKMIKLLKNDKVCKHIHLPLQAGSDKILKEMNRPYDRKEYLDIVKKLQNEIPGIAIGTDIIIGFPGESEVDFNDSLNIVEKVKFAYVHQFTFSIRSGTKAENYKNYCTPQIINQRSKQMRELASKMSLEYKKQFIGKKLISVLEPDKKNGGYNATTDNYIKMHISNNYQEKFCTEKLIPVKFSISDEQCIGEIIFKQEIQNNNAK